MVFYGALAVALVAAACLIHGRPLAPRGGPAGGGMSRRRAWDLCVLALLFLVMTAVAALRIDVGNDYGNYVITFHEIYMDGYVVTEPGFNLFVRLVYGLCGGENYVAVFALFAAATSLLFLKAMYGQSVDFRISFGMFMLLGLYFRTFNTVRYYFVLAVTLYSLRYVLKGEWGKFLLWIASAASFHKSVLVVIPLYLLAALPWKRWQIAVGGAAAASLPLFQDFWMKIVLKLYPSYQNTVYLEKGTGLEGSLMGIIRCIAVLVLCLAVWKDEVPAEGGGKEKEGSQGGEKQEADPGYGSRILERPANRFYFKLNLLGLAVYTCASFLPLVSRFGYYLITAHVLLVPGILCRLPEGRKKRILSAAVLLFCLLSFMYFLRTAHQEGVRVLPYHTWIFTEKEWLNGAFIF